ncbi:hypothetical protein [Mycobacterium sp. PSTR-4-N]|uniref:phage fiber-tail adaptor protein n=1 Tax=Mycobacterium sp. PSTR-4-N TaxID=2917745 RepID=UPI001F14E79A|nr:hypothetical protein [Mycobacterium sp. PSTR-4-N]MCG7592377.1 hypothetical protein [Mycobacterium sp. PSTR-4-N]
MARQTFVGTGTKDPRERIDWTQNWADLLVPLDDHIVALTPIICFPGTLDDASAEITIANSQFTELDTTLTIEDGINGRTYAASCIVDTFRRRRFVRSYRVRCFLK